MSNDFGDEFRNLAGYLRGDTEISPDPGASDLLAGSYFDAFISEARAALNTAAGSPRGRIFEIPPGHFRLEHRASDGLRRSVYELPANVQLYVCPGALIRPDEGVDLVIRGSIAAGPYQIFGYDATQEPGRAPDGRTPPAGRIIFAGKLVPALLPEWWGARTHTPTDYSLQQDCAPAIQAAIEAACVTRDYPEPGSTEPYSRSSLPVLLGGRYLCHRTLTVNVDPTQGIAERHLMLRGRAGLGTPGFGVASIFRVRYDNPLTPGETDDEGCLLRLGPNTSFEIEDLNLTIADESDPTTGADRRIEGCVDIDGYMDVGAPRRGLFRHCTLVGGARYALRIRALDGGIPRHVEVIDCSVAANTPSRLSLHGLEVAAGVSTMVHVEGAMMAVLTGSVDYYPTLASLPDNATIYLQGGSVLLQASGFQGGTGPRPSRGDEVSADSIDLSRPDGQDVFLAPRDDEGGGSSTHFTACTVECQSWWFLSRPQAGDDQIVLWDVTHREADSGEPANRVRYANQPVPRTDTLPANSASEPPSVIWLGEGGQCVFLGCRFGHSVLTDDVAYRQIVDVGTVFAGFMGTSADILSNGMASDWDPRLLPVGPGSHRDHEGVRILDPGGHFRPANNVRSVPRPPTYQYQPIDFELTYDDRIPHVVPLLRPLDG